MFRVTDLQAVEPDELFKNKPEAIKVDVEEQLDSQGFNRVIVTAPTRGELLAFVLNNWGDDAATGGWYQSHVVDRVEALGQPSVYLVIGTGNMASAIAFDERSELVETVDFDDDGTPLWQDASICDHRGAGGPEGFAALHTALTAAERNAELCGIDVKRVA